MTTKTNKFDSRVNDFGIGKEISEGVSADGMQNASGDYPRREYNFGSSINKAALGTKVNQLYTGGGEIGVPLGIPKQMPSQYPFNQVDETPSGHVIEMDDTPGGERVLIKHRKGSGVELRADGTVVISALNNKVEVTGGDQTVIIEGHGNLVYNGNLNLKVSGDYNVEVGGDYNLNVAGNNNTRTNRAHKLEVAGPCIEKYLNTKTEKVLKTNTRTMLSNDFNYVKGNREDGTEGDYKSTSRGDFLISSESQIDIVSPDVNITGAIALNIKGTAGLIGGSHIRFTGQTFSGGSEEENKPITTSPFNADDSDGFGLSQSDSSDNPSGYRTAIFHGTFKGTADKALHASKANSSVLALASSTALGAVGTSTAAAGFIAAASAISGIMAVKDMMANFSQEAEDGGHIPLNPKEVRDLANNLIPTDGPLRRDLALSKPIQHTTVDAGDFIRNETKSYDYYLDTFRRKPTTQEIRSAFRNVDTRLNTLLGAKLIIDGKLHKTYLNAVPPALTGRSASFSQKDRGRYGYTAIGNSLDNRGKRF